MRLRSADPTWAPVIEAGYLAHERDLDALAGLLVPDLLRPAAMGGRHARAA